MPKYERRPVAHNDNDAASPRGKFHAFFFVLFSVEGHCTCKAISSLEDDVAFQTEEAIAPISCFAVTSSIREMAHLSRLLGLYHREFGRS